MRAPSWSCFLPWVGVYFSHRNYYIAQWPKLVHIWAIARIFGCLRIVGFGIWQVPLWTMGMCLFFPLKLLLSLIGQKWSRIFSVGAPSWSWSGGQVPQWEERGPGSVGEPLAKTPIHFLFALHHCCLQKHLIQSHCITRFI